jgi:putative flippase GtrA
MYIKPTTSLRFFKFLLAGGLGATCYIVGSSILTFVGVDAWIASTIVYSCLVPIIYLIQKKFVFESVESHSRSFPRYLTIQLVGIGLSASIPFLLDKLKISQTISFVCVVLLITFTNYVLQLRWAFTKS